MTAAIMVNAVSHIACARPRRDPRARNQKPCAKWQLLYDGSDHFLIRVKEMDLSARDVEGYNPVENLQ